MAILLTQNRSERLFFRWRMAVVYIGGKLSAVEVAFRFRSILLSDAEGHDHLWKRRGVKRKIGGVRSLTLLSSRSVWKVWTRKLLPDVRVRVVPPSPRGPATHTNYYTLMHNHTKSTQSVEKMASDGLLL